MSKKYNIENLKPFKKGDDPRRNLEGRPKVLPELKEAIEKVLSGEENNIEKVLQKLLELALSGDMKAITELLDRYYGKSNQNLNVNLPKEINLPPIKFVDD